MTSKYTLLSFLTYLGSRKIEKGFTFIELLLYVGILTIIMTALIPFAWNAIEGGVKSASQQEVFLQAGLVSNRLGYEIRNASDINSVSPTQISLATANVATNPTTISLNSGNLILQQGSGNPVSLNSQTTKISALTFTNYSSSDNFTKNIQYIFTIGSNYPATGPRQEYNVSTTIEGSAEVRTNAL